MTTSTRRAARCRMNRWRASISSAIGFTVSGTTPFTHHGLNATPLARPQSIGLFRDGPLGPHLAEPVGGVDYIERALKGGVTAQNVTLGIGGIGMGVDDFRALIGTMHGHYCYFEIEPRLIHVLIGEDVRSRQTGRQARSYFWGPRYRSKNRGRSRAGSHRAQARAADCPAHLQRALLARLRMSRAARYGSHPARTDMYP